jgi:hypothetical protein
MASQDPTYAYRKLLSGFGITQLIQERSPLKDKG